METIAIVATCIAILTGILSVVLIIRSGGQKSGTQDADIKYIKEKVDDILLDNMNTNRQIIEHGIKIAVLEEINKNLKSVPDRISRVEESIKSLHKRLDKKEERE